MPSQAASHSGGAVRFSRIVRLPWAVAMGASVSVGLGVYTLLGPFVQRSSGQITLEAYLLLAAAALPLILTYAERAAVTPGSGGIYNVARAGGWLGITFAGGWLALGGYVTLLALLGWGSALYLALLLEQLFGLTLPLAPLAAGVIGLVAVNHLLGSRVHWWMRTGLVFLGLGTLFLVIIRALSAQPPLDLDSFSPRSFERINLAAVMACGLWGIDYVLSLRDEIRQPTRTILPALLLVVLLGAGLGGMAALVLNMRAPVPAGSLVPLLDVAEGWGLVPLDAVHLLYAFFGLSINLIALNRGVVNSLGLLSAMGGDGFFPRWLQATLTMRGTPVLTLLVLAVLGIGLAVWVPVAVLVALAALAFLWTAAVTHLPDLVRARPNLPEKRRPKLPFHPLFPGLTVAVGLFLPFGLTADIRWYGLTWLALGGLVYVAYARQGGVAARRRERVVGEAGTAAADDRHEYRVMVCLDGQQDAASPHRAASLIRAGARLARAREGMLLVLRVIHLAEQMPPHLKRQAAEREWAALDGMARSLEIEGVVIRSLIRLTPVLAEGILEAVGEEGADLLLLGWDQEALPDAPSPDPALNMLVKYAPCDVAVLRGQLPDGPARLLVPTAGGPHAPVALALGRDLAGETGGQISVLHVAAEVDGAPDAPPADGAGDPVQATLRASGLGDAAAAEAAGIRTAVVESATVEEGILAEAEKADLLLLGASRQDALDRPYFGGLAIRVAFASPAPAVVARGREAARLRLLRRAWGFLADPLPALTDERRAQVTEFLYASTAPTLDFFVLITVAAGMASVGMLQDSVATIIAAMLISPDLSPMLAMALGMVRGDLHLLRVAAEAGAKAAAVAIVVGITTVVISPIDQPTHTLYLWAAPSLLDLMLALGAGVAAAYVICRREAAAALPGVAVSAALLIPLTVVGYGLGASRLDIAAGALLLFATNLVAILLASAIVFLAMGFQPKRAERGELVRGLQIAALSLLIVALILGVSTAATVRQLNRQQRVEALFRDGVAARAMQVEELSITRRKGDFVLEATVINFQDQSLSPEEFETLEQDIEDAVGGPVTLRAIVLSGAQLDLDLGDLGAARQIGLLFEQEMASRSVQTLNVAITPRGGGYVVEAILVVEEGDLDDEDLGTIEALLADSAGVPVDLEVIILVGQRSLYGGDTPTPLPLPSSEPAAGPTSEPTPEPTAAPTGGPTRQPTAEPTEGPTAGPTLQPTPQPTLEVTGEPTIEPTDAPTLQPTPEPTEGATGVPTAEPTLEPTPEPTPGG